VDAFVFLDSVQFEKQSWQQRNRIKTPNGLQWLTVPVVFRGRFGQAIHEVEIRDGELARKHMRAIELSYRRAPYFERYWPELAGILQEFGAGSLLVDLNIRIIQWLAALLNINTRMVRSSAIKPSGKRSELLSIYAAAWKQRLICLRWARRSTSWMNSTCSQMHPSASGFITMSIPNIGSYSRHSRRMRQLSTCSSTKARTQAAFCAPAAGRLMRPRKLQAAW
jgi:hypothetical protein